jgi:hypothetical protein
MRSMKQRIMVFVADDQRARTLANLRRFAAGPVQAERAECLRQTLGQVEDQQRSFAKISTSLCRQ